MSDRETPVLKRILLVGFMGSGKTEVGQALAERLGWSFKDFDQEIRARVGLPIPRIFREHGEGFFRQMEERVGAELLKEERVVLASGGGWAVALGRMEDLPPGTVSVWLKVSAEEAVRRARQDGPTRPLLAVPDAVGRARELLDDRTPQYSQADLVVDSDRSTPEVLAETIENLLNETGSLGGRPFSPYT